MPEKPSLAFTNLRKQAEEVLNQRHGNGVAEPAQTDLRHLLHELETHQVELEIQNEELRKTQQELEASRNEYLDLYHSAPVGFLSVNAKGVITRINRAAAEMFASPGKILVGDIFLSLIYATDVQIYMRFLNKAGLMKNEVCELQMVGKDGNILHVRLEARAELEGGKKIRHFAVTDLTELKRIKKELEQRVLERTAELNRRAEQLARLTSELMLTEQRERRRIAEILHDHLQQLLVGAKMNSEVLVPELEGNQRRVLEKIKDLIDKSIQASRTLTAELSPPALQQGRLSAALEWLAHWMKKHHGLTVEWRANTDLDPEREDITYLLYQCVRELLFNVVKHSGVESARIEMSDENDMLQVAVCDNGPGFDPKTIDETEETGFGLFSIRERLALLGGTLAVESISGGGVRVSISMPLDSVDMKSGKRPEAHNSEPHVFAPNGDIIKVLLADDHKVVRQGLSTMLGLQPDIKVIGEASNGKEAVELARELKPDVILMDVTMPELDGLKASRIIHSEMPYIRIIGLSMHEPKDQADSMMASGASAYCTKDAETSAILSAIRGEY